MEYLARSVGVFADLHLERNVPDMVQTKRHQAALDETVNTKRHNRVLVSRPLRECLDSRTDRRPYERQHHTGENSGQTRNDRHEALACKEAQILRQFDAVEAVKHIRCDRAGDNTAKHPPCQRGVLRQSLQQVNAEPAVQPQPWFSP
ncbi:Uncharacterised protein [Salmonella enterica subsp. arizonae]|uniref:Uncharacterized protein n=1 Tax=Salmonella enterica subsp. arizonae TaxID=59203 RepID=A0A379SXH2_SALER|nr:Uncharacterised protein [Salmonella enterica subsp. arizonae]